MGIFDSDYKLQKWKYKVDLVEIYVKNKKEFTIPNERVTGIYILEDFENWVFPVFRLSMVLPSSSYMKIIKNKSTVEFHIRLHKYYNYQDDVNNPKLKRVAIDDMYSLILDDDDEDMNAAKRKEELKNDYTKVKADDTNDLRLVDNAKEFFLYKKKIAVNLKKHVNKVFKNVTVTEVISYLMYELNLKNVLMSLPTNTKRYGTLMIPNMTILNALKFLDTFYGIYDKGSLIFFGFDHTYILKYTGKCDAYTSSEKRNVRIVIPQQVSNHIAGTGVLETKKSDNKIYITAQYQTIGTRNDSISHGLIQGNDITVVENASGSVNTETNKSIDNINSGRTKNQLNKTMNPWIAKTYSQQAKMNDNVVELRLGDYDYNILRPNKNIGILFEDPALTKKYDGDYILCGIESSFVKEGEYFVLNSICKLKKS